MNHYSYFRLLDKTNFGTILRGDPKSIPERFIGTKGWIPTTLFLDYTIEISPTYDMYEEISEELALKYVEEQTKSNPK
jgi:hypothetical protein